MPTDGQDLDATCEALATVLRGVTGIGVVSAHPWERDPGWLTRNGAAQAYWEVDVASIVETGAGVGPQNWEQLVFRVEGWLPFSRTNPRTFPVWRDLLVRVRNAIRSNPVLRVEGVVHIRDLGAPQLTEQNMGDFADGEKSVRCHHCVIVATGMRWLTYQPI